MSDTAPIASTEDLIALRQRLSAEAWELCLEQIRQTDPAAYEALKDEPSGLVFCPSDLQRGSK